MGARVSIQFENRQEKSVILFSHWGGEELINTANKYLDDLKAELSQKDPGISDPITRLEPNTVMVDFVRYLTKDAGRITGNLYLAASECEGDSSDYGHHIINL